MKAIVNSAIIMNNSVLKGHTVLFDEKIREIKEESVADLRGTEEVIDAQGRFLSPGFIDLHIHGCSGSDTMDDNDISIGNISRSLPATGVTSFLPTTMTMSQPAIRKTIDRIRRLMGHEPGATILGCYLEGPFISEEYKGAQYGGFIRKPDFKIIEGFLDVIRIVILAPEEEGSGEFIENCSKHGIITAIGHSGASYEQAMEAIRKGASHITHTFNAMAPLHHRKPGVVGAAMDSSASCELIADNIHVDPAVQRILLKVKGTDNIVLVTDAMRACMLEDGEYDLGGQKVLLKGAEVRLESGALAGSVLTIDRALRNFRANTGISVVDAVSTVTANPARILGLEDRKGSISEGKDADLVIFDEQFNIYGTFIKGKTVYEKK
ncbi:MAG TPA: N-acetylglucosamine-6-phosphate deacetylase [Bacillota bacterium]|nr:N-acetylglucosamine-6-phosphate deacetylase [Bacillota bacterium]HPL53802.1 N-acetylglucosamine-6-phosphate deacetylase [Bacillota bacterium]